MTQPIITSLLDNDLYKFTMLQAMLHQFPQTHGVYRFRCRNYKDTAYPLADIKEALEDAGYYFRYQVLNSMEYGNVPQNRERIYVVGFRSKEECDRFYFPEPVKLTTKITDIIKPHEKKDEKFYYMNSKYYPMLSEAMTNKDTVYQLRRVYVRENKKGVSPTLTANMGTGGHNVPLVIDDFGIRKLTPKECFELQGFPKTYKLPEKMANSHLYKQAGNSVTVTVIEKIAERMLEAMK